MFHNKKILILFFILFYQTAVYSQPKTKQVLIEGSGPAVVLLHGGTFDFTAFADHSGLLADSFTAIRMLQFNVQFADRGWTLPKNYSVKTESKAVLATLDSLQITESVVLVGHSYGGVIAFDLAVNHPERIQSLVLVEAPLFGLARKKGKYSDMMKEGAELTKLFTPQANITEEMIKDFRCRFAGCDTFDIRQHPMWPKWLQHKDRLKGLSAVPRYKVDLKKLKAFQKPVLIVTGTETIEPHKTIDQLLSLEFPNAGTGSLPGNHIAIYQNAKVFVEMLKQFLSRRVSEGTRRHFRPPGVLPG